MIQKLKSAISFLFEKSHFCLKVQSEFASKHATSGFLISYILIGPNHFLADIVKKFQVEYLAYF